MGHTLRSPFEAGEVNHRRIYGILDIVEGELTIDTDTVADDAFIDLRDGFEPVQVHDYNLDEVVQNPANPFGDIIDWAEAESVGLHIVGSGTPIHPSGDLHNAPGNHAHHSSFMGGMLRAGHDIASIEGFDAQLH